MPNDYHIIERAPTLEEYRRMTYAVGWQDLTNFDVAETALRNAIFHVVVCFGDEIVGMGRIVGDGAMFYYLQDVSVVPEHRGRGIGRLIVDRLMLYVKSNAPDRAFVGLFATEGHEDFYHHYGFEIDPSYTGMLYWIQK